MSNVPFTGQQAIAILMALSKSQQELVTNVELVPGENPTVTVTKTTIGQTIKDLGFFNETPSS